MPPNLHRAISPEIAGKLGQVSDRELAKLSGLSPYFIKQARLAKNIEPVSRGYDLPDELVQQLGKVPDAQLTEHYGVPGPVLCRARKERSIPRFRILYTPDSSEYVAFSEEALALLGKISDIELAKRFDRSRREVKQEREVRGVEPYTRGRSLRIKPTPLVTIRATETVWSPEILSRLGQVKDIEVARLIGISPTTVGLKRKSLGIPPVLAGGWTQELLSLLGKVPDKELSERSGGLLTENSVCKARLLRKIPVCEALKPPPKAESAEVQSLLGVVNDYEIARRTGVSRSDITRLRLRLGIAPAKSGRLPRRKPRAPGSAYAISPHEAKGVDRIWTQEEDALLGTAADSKVAALLKVDFWAVFNRRKEMNIPPYEFAYS